MCIRDRAYAAADQAWLQARSTYETATETLRQAKENKMSIRDRAYACHIAELTAELLHAPLVQDYCCTQPCEGQNGLLCLLYTSRCV